MPAKIFYLIIKMFKGKKIITLLMMIQIFISLLLFNISFARINHYLTITNIVKSTKISNSIYFVPDIRYFSDVNSEKPYKMIDEKINNLRNLEYFTNIKQLTGSINVNQNNPLITTLLMYNNKLIQDIKLPLSDGKWIKAYAENDKVPIIISHDLSKYYRTGDIIKIQCYKKDSSPETINTIVYGILDKPNNYLSLGAGGDIISIDQLFFRDTNIIIMPQIKGLDGFDQKAKFLFMKEGSNKSDTLSAWERSLKGIGYISPVSKMVDIYKISLKKSLATEFSICIIVLLLTIVGIGGNNVLSLIFQEKEFATYFMCGLKWSKCTFMILAKDILVLVIPGIATIFAIKYSIEPSMLGKSLLFNNYSFVVSFSIVLTIFLFTSVESILRLKKASPISIIRGR